MSSAGRPFSDTLAAATARAPLAGRSEPVQLVLLAALGCALSVAVTGHVSGFSNNLFHLPILIGLYDEPQFLGDPWMQSLRSYFSGFWMLAAHAGRTVDSFLFLLVATILARFLCFLAFLSCASLLGIVSVRQRLLFVLLLAFSTVLQGYSFAGGGDLFGRYFSHSTLANATTLFSLSCAARGRFGRSFAWNGLTFFINAFFAVWNAIPLALIAAVLIARRQIEPGTLLRRAAAGLVAFALLALPVLLAMRAAGAAQPIGFDYIQFLRELWPFHFLIDEVPPLEIAALLALFVTAALAYRQLGRGAEPFAAALAGFGLVWLVGTVIPSLTAEPLILNLHLLRAGTGVHLMAALGLAVLAVRWIEKKSKRAWGALLALATTTVGPLLVLAAPLILLGRSDRYSGKVAGRRTARLTAGLLLILLWPTIIIAHQLGAARAREFIGAWRNVGEWARAATPQTAVFLIPPGVSPRVPASYRKADPAEGDLARGHEVFEYFSHRRVWVDFKRGGAVPWQPGYYPVWHGRLAEVMALRSTGQRLAYARSRRIDYVVDRCGGGPQAAVRFAEGPLCVYEASAP